MSRACVVTGASTGIGRATAKKLAERGFRVFGSVRRIADAEALRDELGDALTPLLFDVTNTEAVRAAAAQVARELGPRDKLAGLVNNAGVAVAGPMLELPLEDLRRQLEVNVVAQVGVMQAFAPLLGTDRARTGPPGRIVNMSSVAGRMAFPFMGPYCASKHALEAISDALRREMLLYGIEVVVIEPGAVATPIWDKAEAADMSGVEGTEYAKPAKTMMTQMLADGRKGLPPERIAEAVLRGLTERRPPTRIAVVPQRFRNWTIPRLLPDRLLDAMVGRLFGLKPL